MARQRQAETRRSRRRPATSPEARENELSSAAYDLAEEQIHSGTASSQVITHFLKMGSSRERKEQMRMDHEIHLMEVKAEQLEGQKRVEELYANALEAMRGYSGIGSAQDSIDGEFVED
jgi:hypothetical protein